MSDPNYRRRCFSFWFHCGQFAFLVFAFLHKSNCRKLVTTLGDWRPEVLETRPEYCKLVWAMRIKRARCGVRGETGTSSLNQNRRVKWCSWRLNQTTCTSGKGSKSLSPGDKPKELFLLWRTQDEFFTEKLTRGSDLIWCLQTTETSVWVRNIYSGMSFCSL